MKGHPHGSILILMKGWFTMRCRSSKLSLCQTLQYCWPSQQDNRINFSFKIKVVCLCSTSQLSTNSWQPSYLLRLPVKLPEQLTGTSVSRARLEGIQGRLAFMGGRSRRLLELGVRLENLPPSRGRAVNIPGKRPEGKGNSDMAPWHHPCAPGLRKNSFPKEGSTRERPPSESSL